MWLSDTSVKRPVFATVLSMLLIALGALSFRDLTVREQPDTVSPTVQVQVGYPGANAEVIETRITQVLEAELSGIEGVKNIRSQSRDGQASLTLEFYLDRNLDEAANDATFGDEEIRITKLLAKLKRYGRPQFTLATAQKTHPFHCWRMMRYQHNVS